ncbi:GntR family transcriptional regulator [Labrys monachus]|uniref:DNA-binding GntR family transcriptional regulator n=1 Tax=Labrys monachus TaxID=217067 RepID=A0ABU0FN23_9HYPH|nr:GntR family transcriptional regulator [Labrys monachus]MDQ0396010.1 DNA-binding GntR family transcriptional regulator [Labrys monachus]
MTEPTIRQPATDRVRDMVAALEEQIVLGWLMPRERLLEDRLAEQFSCKKHVVREALSELERMGLVDRVPNKGAMVRLLGPEEVRQIYSVREALETLAAEQIPLPAAADFIARLTQIQARHAQAIDANDPRAAFRANMAFHEALFSACGNPYLAEVIRSAAQKVHGARFFTAASRLHLTRARDEHWAMIEALRAGDRKTLVALCRSHIGPSRDTYLAAVQSRAAQGE